MYAPEVVTPPREKGLTRAAICVVASTLIIPLNTVVWIVAVASKDMAQTLWLVVFGLFAALQTALGIAALVFGFGHALSKRFPTANRVLTGFLALVGLALAAAGMVGGFLGLVLHDLKGLGAMGGAWGRPLRVRGRQLHPEVREGSDWTEGARPDARDLDEPTRRALEALWLHDAQKEHASVPAFARVSWMLAAVGAPPSLVEGAHRAALEEAEHTKLCFALAAGYGGRTHTVEPMPDLLVAGLSLEGRDAYEALAIESLQDGCLLEDFNADVAGACARVCREPVTAAVLHQIAREERSHADFSWAVLEWVLEHHGDRLHARISSAIERLDRVVRPTSASSTVAPLVTEAMESALRAHGRLRDDEWAAHWQARLLATKERARALLDGVALAA